MDAKCETGKGPVYFEVIAPEQSEANIESQRLIDELSQRMRTIVTACRVEVELFSPPTESEMEAIISAYRVANPGEWMTVESIARIRKTVAGQVLPPVFDGDGAQIKVVGEGAGDVKGDSGYSIIRLETSDNRAKRLFNEEYHHFSEGVANVLVINMSAIADGIAEWENLIRRLFQPTQNRKVGAVLFFNQSITGPPEGIRRHWRTVVNPFAHKKVPNTLLEGFLSLSEA